MKDTLLWKMLEVGEACGLETVGQAYDNLELHYDCFVNVDTANEEFRELQQMMADNGLIVDKQIVEMEIKTAMEIL